MISQKAKYALRALLVLAKSPPDEAHVIGHIASSQNIPKKFLEQILLELKQNGILASKRGKTGGYLMARPPREVTFGEVLRLLDGPVAPLPCLSKTAYQRCADCGREEDCEIRKVFARVADATRRVLDQTTIADATDNNIP